MATFLALMIVILLAATYLRVHALQQWPPGLSRDEAINGMDAVRILRTGTFPTYRGDGRPEPLFRYIQALTVGLFGPTRFGLRTASVFVGVLSVAAAARASRHLAPPISPGLRRWLPLLSAATLAVLVGHVSISRVAYRAILLPFALFLFLDSLAVAWKTGRHMAFAWAGAFLGLCLHSYTAGIVSLAALPISVAHQAIFDGSLLKRRLRGLVLLMAVLALVIVPLVILFAIQPVIYQRAGELASGEETGATVQGVTQSLDDLRRTAKSFYNRGDVNPQYNVSRAPLLHTVPLVAIFMLGVASSLLWPRHLTSPLLLALLVGFMMPVALAGEIPHGLRISGEFFVMPLLVASGVGLLVWLVERLPPFRFVARSVLALLVTGALLHAGLKTAGLYFGYWEQDLYYGTGEGQVQMFSWFFEGPRTTMAEFAADHAGPVYLPLVEMDHPTLRFLTTYSHPRITTFAERLEPDGSLSLPSGTFVLPPMTHLTGSYALLESDGTLTLLPRFDETTLAQLEMARDTSDDSLVDAFGVTAATLVDFPPQGTDLRLDPAVAYNALANYDGQLRLVGWAGPTQLPAQIDGTQRFEFTLYLAPGPNQMRDLNLFAQVWTLDDESLGGRDIDINRWLYPNSLWHTGDIVPVTVRFPLGEEPIELAPGGYRLVVGVNDAWMRRLPVLDESGVPTGDVALAGGLKVPDSDPPDLEAMQTVNWRLGDVIKLVGYRLESQGVPINVLGPGDDATLTLAWAATGKPPDDYTAFFHLQDANGNLIAQFDVEPADGLFPTSTWDAGETYTSLHPVAIPPAAGPGPYQLLVGMYSWPDLERLPVRHGDAAPEDRRIPLLTISGS